MAKTSTLFFRADPSLAAALERMAGEASVPVSALLRDMALDAVDERDRALAERLTEGTEPEALAELLSLNIRSLVHRFALRDEFAGSLIRHLTAKGSDEQRRELICALVAAVDQLTMPAVDIDGLNAATDLHMRQLAQIAGAG